MDTLHYNGQHYIVIVDPGIHTNPQYTPYTQLIQNDLAILNSSSLPFLGQVWPGETGAAHTQPSFATDERHS